MECSTQVMSLFPFCLCVPDYTLQKEDRHLWMDKVHVPTSNVEFLSLLTHMLEHEIIWMFLHLLTQSEVG